MIAAILFVVSAALIGWIAFYHWRARISKIAAHDISNRIRTAAGITAPEICARDFRSLLSLHDLAQDLHGPNGGFHAVRTYYSVVEKLASLIPATANWANVEMVTCSRYVAVLMDQHLKRNMARAAQIRGI